MVAGGHGILGVLFERFTEQTRQVVVLAQQEARSLQHNYIGTEHLLLGLLHEEDALAARVLELFDVTLEHTRADVRRIVGAGDEPPAGQIPFTPRAKKVLELSLREAMNLGHNYIGSEHILLGLVRENEGLAARILADAGADADKIWEKVIRALVRGGARPPTLPPPEGSRGPWQRIAPGWLDELGPMLNQLAEEIRRELGREPDAGDLLLVLTAAPHALPAQAIQQLAIDLDQLWGQIERLRQQAGSTREELDCQLEQTRADKQRAIEATQFETAARLRDQGRKLTEQQRAQTIVSPQALQAVRRRLGLPPRPSHQPPGTLTQ